MQAVDDADGGCRHARPTHGAYHASKVRAELLCAAADPRVALSLPRDSTAACSPAAAAGAMRVIVLRPPGIYGERSLYHVTAELAAARDLGRANVIFIGAGDSVFQRCYAGNVAHAHLCAAAALLQPQAPAQRLFNITDDTPVVNFFAFAEPYLRGKGYRPPSIGVPWCITRPVALVVNLVNAFLLLLGVGCKRLLLTPMAVDGAAAASRQPSSSALSLHVRRGLFDVLGQGLCRPPLVELRANFHPQPIVPSHHGLLQTPSPFPPWPCRHAPRVVACADSCPPSAGRRRQPRACVDARQELLDCNWDAAAADAVQLHSKHCVAATAADRCHP